MRKIVVDTNVLVSALLSPKGKPAQILALILNEQVTVCYDSRIMLEYETVLSRSKFPFESQDISALINKVLKTGISIIPMPSELEFSDRDDKKFYDAAKGAGVYLVTGNRKHFPDEPCIISSADFLEIRG